MKIQRILTIIWLILFINKAVAISEGDKLESLKTLDGKTFTGVTISKISKEGVRFIHSTGVATVSAQQLSQELLTSFGLSIADAEDAREEREQLQKQSTEKSRQRLELLSKSRIIDGRIIQVLPDKKAALVELSKEGFITTCSADIEARKKSLASKFPFGNTPNARMNPGIERAQKNYLSMIECLKVVPVSCKWNFPNDQQVVWIDLESTEGLIDNKMICGAIGAATNWKKEMWIVEEIGTTSYDTSIGTRTARRFKRRSEL
jgi:hypothetical protein